MILVYVIYAFTCVLKHGIFVYIHGALYTCKHRQFLLIFLLVLEKNAQRCCLKPKIPPPPPSQPLTPSKYLCKPTFMVGKFFMKCRSVCFVKKKKCVWKDAVLEGNTVCFSLCSNKWYKWYESCMAAKSDGGGGWFYPKHEKAAFREKEAWHLRLISGMCFYFESLCKLTHCGKKKRKGIQCHGKERTRCCRSSAREGTGI